MPIYEFCAENVTLLEKAFKAGAVLNAWSCVIIWLLEARRLLMVS